MKDAAITDADRPILIEGARVVLDDRVEEVSVRIEAGRIAGLDTGADGATRIDAGGMVLAPAMIDVHGDAFERQMMPRPGVTVPTAPALLETDRQLGANGIGTAYHALTLSWEPGLRSVETGWQVYEGLQALAPRLTVDNRLQLRWETFCFEALPLIEAALATDPRPSIAFNDHTTMAALHPDVPIQERPFDHAPNYPVVDMASDEFAQKMESRARRAHLPVADFVALFRKMWDRRGEVPTMVETVAEHGRAAGAPMFSHDDSQPRTRAHFRALGSRVSEFPMNLATATEAREAGDLIVFGAPNAARGGSHLGSPGAGEMVRRGLCDILASDYYYPAMLAAVARLKADGIGELPALWRLVASNPARASGLLDRGRIKPGLRADLVLIDWPEDGTPAVRQTWVAGRTAYSARAAG